MNTLRTTKYPLIELGLLLGIGLIVFSLILLVILPISPSESPISPQELLRLRQHSWPSNHCPIPLFRGV